MVGWHHWLNGHASEQRLGTVEGQGILACWSPWGWKESGMTEQLNNIRRYLGHKGGALMNGISPFIKEAPGRSLVSSTFEDTERRHHIWNRKWALNSHRTEYMSTMILNFLASRLSEIVCYLFISYPTCGALLQQPKWTNRVLRQDFMHRKARPFDKDESLLANLEGSRRLSPLGLGRNLRDWLPEDRYALHLQEVEKQESRQWERWKKEGRTERP